MITSRSVTVGDGGVRLDAAIVDLFPSSSRAFVREAVSCGDILVNGKPAFKGLKLRGGERIEIKRLAESCDNTVAPNPEIRVRYVYGDELLLAVDKPAGMPVQPLSRSETTTLMNGVAADHPECIPLGDRPLLAGAIHRIDADTSGLVLVARTAEAFGALREQFARQTVEKTYLALVEGNVTTGGTLENELIHDPTLPFCRMIDPRTKPLNSLKHLKPLPARTQYEPVGHVKVENEDRTLLKVTIFTGVTHQIRAQLSIAGMHIVNDRLYGAFAVEGQTGHCLHALRVKFIHPVSSQPLEISTALPAWAQDHDIGS